MMRIPSSAPILSVALVLLCGWLVAESGLRFNFTRSLPRGIYREVDKRIDRGRIALLCLPGPVAATRAGISFRSRSFSFGRAPGGRHDGDGRRIRGMTGTCGSSLLKSADR